MKQVGVTGGIGSGKSVVCQIFSALGVPIYNADDRAKWLIQHDPSLVSSTNPSLLQQLNALVHPLVGLDTQKWNASHTSFQYVIKEAALFNKAGKGNSLDTLVVVTAPLELRIKRILKRDTQRTEAEVRNIIARQASDEERLQMADYVIVNDESELLVEQVLRLHQRFSI
jgi:dephospho-CoA kinase